jgi:hypothetical protein
MDIIFPPHTRQEPRHHLLGTNKITDDYEIDPGQVKLGVEIGKGAFGRVHLATVENLSGLPGPTLVAVKQIKSTGIATISTQCYTSL